jgi:hypothetical protein
MRTNVAAFGAAVIAAGLIGAGLTGCSAKGEPNAAKPMSAADLQTRLTEQLTEAGNPPESVNCKDELVAEVGKSTTCDVVFSDTNSVEAKVTTTEVDESGVSFDLSPSLTKKQLEKGVSGLTNATAVSCDSGLDGAIGETTTCEVTVDGVVSKRVAAIDGVNGLMMDLSVVPVVPKEQLQELLIQRLNADGTPAETVECVSDATDKPGTSVECVAVTGDEKRGYDVSVTTIEGDNVGIEYSDSATP